MHFTFIRKIPFKFCNRIGAFGSTGINSALFFFYITEVSLLNYKERIIVPSYGWLSLGLNKNICKAIMTVQDHKLYSEDSC